MEDGYCEDSGCVVCYPELLDDWWDYDCPELLEWYDV